MKNKVAIPLQSDNTEHKEDHRETCPCSICSEIRDIERSNPAYPGKELTTEGKEESQEEMWDDLYCKIDWIQREYDPVNYGLAYQDDMMIKTTQELKKHFTITRKP